MGCDIHAYIEYVNGTNHVGEKDYWGFGKRTRIWRDYWLFALMAGVRNYWDVKPVAEPRGVPKDTSYDVREDYLLYVSENCPDEQGNCSKEDAKRWLEYNCSQQWDENRITGPDWHTPSWLTLDELKLVLKRYIEENPYDIKRPYGKELNAIIAAMEKLPDSRLVFWFDN
jgi:hypothetical protein